MSVHLITAPTEQLVSLASAKLHLKVEDNDDDTLIDAIRAAATDIVEHDTRRVFVQREFRLDTNTFYRVMHLPPFGLASIVSVAYYDSDNVNQAVDSANYRIDTGKAEMHFDGAFDLPNVYDRHDAVRIQFLSGVSDATLIPQAAVSAAYLLIGDMYENREAQVLGLNVNQNKTVERLISSIQMPLDRQDRL